MIWIIFLSLTLILLITYYKKTFSYWSKQNVPGPLPLPFFGTAIYLMMNDLIKNDLDSTKKYGKFHGEYLGNESLFVIHDPDLAYQVLVKDFHVFNQSQKKMFTTYPFTKMINSLYGNAWKRVRTVISPTFTGVKLRKALFHLKGPMDNTYKNIDEGMINSTSSNVFLRELVRGFSLDAIANFVFAVQPNSYKNPNDPFVKSATDMTMFKSHFFFLSQLLPEPAKTFFGKKALCQKSVNYCVNLAKEVLRQRRANPEVKYKDFLDLLLDSKEKLDDDEMIAQTIIFLFGGIHTISIALTIILGDIAIKKKYQKRLREEIFEIIGDKEVDYENIKKLTFLDAIICESLRLKPIAHRLMRLPQEDYKLANTGVTLKKGQMTIISVGSIHYNETLFPDPFKYDPERWMNDNKKQLKQQGYLEFGLGPRACVAIRLAMIELKYFIIHILKKYEISISKGYPIPLEFERGSFSLIPKAFNVDFTLLKKEQ